MSCSRHTVTDLACLPVLWMVTYSLFSFAVVSVPAGLYRMKEIRISPWAVAGTAVSRTVAANARMDPGASKAS